MSTDPEPDIVAQVLKGLGPEGWATEEGDAAVSFSDVPSDGHSGASYTIISITPAGPTSHSGDLVATLGPGFRALTLIPGCGGGEVQLRQFVGEPVSMLISVPAPITDQQQAACVCGCIMAALAAIRSMDKEGYDG
jgi:hypothetical protein